MTTIYYMRHSEPFKRNLGIQDIKEKALETNKKNPLSTVGESLAKEISEKEEFKDLDIVWSSDYVRSMSTAKYFAEKNNMKVNISDKFGERVHGIDSWSELPENFELKQYNDFNYKLENGESINDTKTRMYNALLKVLELYKDKKVLIVSHSTAIASLLSIWSKIDFQGDYSFNNKVYFDGKWDYCETFKLTFDDNNSLISIENIKE